MEYYFLVISKRSKFAEICCVLSFYCLIKSRKDNIMKKNVMRPLTEAEMKTLNGGGWLGLLLSKAVKAFLDWVLPDGKCKEAAVGITSTTVAVLV